jgi:hypothetical protein
MRKTGEPVAELRPLSTSQPMPSNQKARVFDAMRKIWVRMPQLIDSTKLIEEDRDR